MSSAKQSVLKGKPAEAVTDRKLRSQAKKTATKKKAQPAKTPKVAPAKKSETTNQGQAPQLKLTTEEINFILQARKDGTKAEAYKKTNPQNGASPAGANGAEEPQTEEAAYANILGNSSVLDEVHAHCLGIVQMDPLTLRGYVATALANAKQWELLPGVKEKVRGAVVKALPVLARGLLKEEGLPVPNSFSTDKVVETYRDILARFLRITECLSKKRSRRAKNKDLSESEEPGDSSGEDSSDGGSDKRSKEIKKYTKEVEESLRIGEDDYPDPHLYECERLLKTYKEWRDPMDPTERKATVPREVRSFIKKHLADEAPVLEAYEQKHVKGSQSEQKHITFLLNEMGYLASKICKERLARSGKEMSRDGRIRKGHVMSKKEREASIKGEKEMAARVRWYGNLLSEGVAGWEEFKKGTKSKATQSNLLAAGLFSAAEAKKVATSVCKTSKRKRSRSRSRSKSRSRRRPTGGRYRRGRRRYSRERSRGRRGRDRTPRDRRREHGDKGGSKGSLCWHCNEYGHLVMNCPSAAAGKAPHKDSRFAKSRKKNKDKS